MHFGLGSVRKAEVGRGGAVFVVWFSSVIVRFFHSGRQRQTGRLMSVQLLWFRALFESELQLHCLRSALGSECQECRVNREAFSLREAVLNIVPCKLHVAL